jgi:hypothetical protein
LEEELDHDGVICLSGKVKKRKKKLSKEQYGTSHTVSLAEAGAVARRTLAAPRIQGQGRTTLHTATRRGSGSSGI